MNSINQRHLIKVLHTYKDRNPTTTIQQMLLHLSDWIVQHFVSKDFYTQTFLSPTRSLTDEERLSRTFVYSNEPQNSSRYLGFRSQRVMELAQALFNTQHTEGVGERITSMYKIGLRPIFAELTAAEYILRSKLECKFISESGKKHADYDLEVKAQDGTTLYCEVESKQDVTALSANTIYNSLEHAKSQLPKTGPGLLYLHIPYSWNDVLQVRELAQQAVQRLFRHTSRVVAVRITWDEWSSDGMRCQSMSDFYRHPSAFTDDQQVQSVLDLLGIRHTVGKVDELSGNIFIEILDPSYYISPNYLNLYTFVRSYTELYR